MKKIKFFIVCLSAIISCSSSICNAQTREEWEEAKQMFIVTVKSMLFGEDVVDALEENGIDASCFCEKYPVIIWDFCIKKLQITDYNLDMEKLYSMTVDLVDHNSVLHNELMAEASASLMKCLKNVAKITVSGSAAKDTVPLIKINNMHLIKLTLGASSKAYLMDSGASISLISEEYAEELYDAGVITPSLYQGIRQMSMADGSTVDVDIYMLNGVKIGSYTLNNVEFGVIDGDIDFLLGANVLGAFTSFKIINSDNSIMELVK
jgi:predicted aspartyl protease